MVDPIPNDTLQSLPLTDQIFDGRPNFSCIRNYNLHGTPADSVMALPLGHQSVVLRWDGVARIVLMHCASATSLAKE